MNIQEARESRTQLITRGQEALRLVADVQPLYLFGTTIYAIRVAAARAGRPVIFIDDGRAGERFFDSPVVALAQVPSDATVVGCVVEGRPRTVHRLLRESGMRSILDYYQLNAADPAGFPIPFWENNVADIEANGAKYEWLHDLLEDEDSKRELAGLLNFRYTNDPLQGSFSYHLHEQYWEPFLELTSVRSFVDGGSFDGRTSLEFIQRQPDYARVDVFEPFSASLTTARRTLAGLRDVHFHPLAILDGARTLRFTSGAGSANTLCGGGDTEVRTCALDEELRGVRADMIKLDIEGAEPQAIDGAKNTIREQRPVLAVCVYHDQSHFWRIPERILSIRPDYRVRLRHYTEGVYETVMYFF